MLRFKKNLESFRDSGRISSPRLRISLVDKAEFLDTRRHWRIQKIREIRERWEGWIRRRKKATNGSGGAGKVGVGSEPTITPLWRDRGG